jgi:hypothetical protein
MPSPSGRGSQCPLPLGEGLGEGISAFSSPEEPSLFSNRSAIGADSRHELSQFSCDAVSLR